MVDIDLDLQAVEDQMADAEDESGRVVLGVLDGTTPDEEWVAEVEGGSVLVLDVEGDVNDLAAGFARDVVDMGGELVHFREFLLVAPPGVVIDTERL